jgi:hypothetical protein
MPQTIRYLTRSILADVPNAKGATRHHGLPSKELRKLSDTARFPVITHMWNDEGSAGSRNGVRVIAAFGADDLGNDTNILSIDLPYETFKNLPVAEIPDDDDEDVEGKSHVDADPV